MGEKIGWREILNESDETKMKKKFALNSANFLINSLKSEKFAKFKPYLI